MAVGARRRSRRAAEDRKILSSASQPPLDRRVVITALGIGQIMAWGTSFYFPAVFAGPIVAETGWSLGHVVAGT